MQKHPDTTQSLHPAILTWRDGTPASLDYGDVYYSRADGLDEARHVFLNHNDLPRRWQQPTPAEAHFIIIESGFGTGLNFLAAWQLWRQLHQSAPNGDHAVDPVPANRPMLHYISIEKHPLAAQHLSHAGTVWPELESLAQRLAQHYPPLLPGLHSRRVDYDVQLTLGFGDILTVLHQLGDCDHPALRDRTSIKANAWFLDGFAPARNPDMWSAEVFKGIADLSKPGSTFATFTAAGIVKRGLAKAGFEVSKTDGYGRKRDMLRGSFSRARPLSAEVSPGQRRGTRGAHALAWHTVASENAAPASTAHQRQALVIGAGLAGCHTARSLAERGWQVSLVERKPAIAQGASGNPVGLLYSRLSASASEQSAFYLSSYDYARHHYRQLFANSALQSDRDGQLQGLLQLGYSAREQKQQHALARCFEAHPNLLRPVSASEASQLAGVKVEHPGLLFPGGGWLQPQQVCAALVTHPNISLHTHFTVASLERSGQYWEATNSRGKRINAPICIVCSSLDSAALPQLQWLPVRAVSGQITLVPADAGHAPLLPLCHAGYVAPGIGGEICCGASFRVNDDRSELLLNDQQQNLSQLAHYLPGVLSSARAATLSMSALPGRASVRCTSPDYLPIVGRVPDPNPFRKRFARLSRDARTDIDQCGVFYPGLYVNTAHGSKGLNSTPIAAELLAALLDGTPRPLAWPLVRALSPARFLVRELIRSTR